MKNNKGFTLVELIATILLIILSSTVVVINLQGQQSSKSTSTEEKSRARITEIACNAIDSIDAKNITGKTRDECKNGGGCKVTLARLIEVGLIDGYATFDDQGRKMNEMVQDDTGKKMKVNIKWQSESGYLVKKCTIIMEN